MGSRAIPGGRQQLQSVPSAGKMVFNREDGKEIVHPEHTAVPEAVKP